MFKKRSECPGERKKKYLLSLEVVPRGERKKRKLLTLKGGGFRQLNSVAERNDNEGKRKSYTYSKGEEWFRASSIWERKEGVSSPFTVWDQERKKERKSLKCNP